jgi:hypothetical protein
MGSDDLRPEHLADLLQEAEKAHASYERELGDRDENRPIWDTQHIVEQLALD